MIIPLPKRINKIKSVLSKEKDLTITAIAKKCNLPQSTISLYLNNYLKDIINIIRSGKDKKISLITNSQSIFERNLERYNSRIDMAINLRKKGYSFSEIKEVLTKNNLKISDGILSNSLKNIKMKNENKERYIQKIKKDRQEAGKIGGKIRSSMKDFINLQKIATKKAVEINTKEISKYFQKLTIEKRRLIGHCQFDGSIVNTERYKAISYTNKSKALINQFKQDMQKVYGLHPTDIRIKGNNVFSIRYCCLKAVLDTRELLEKGIPYRIMHASEKEKLVFLKTFWDDEGAIHFGITRDKNQGFHKSIYVEAFCEDKVVRTQLIKMHQDLGFKMLLFDKKIRLSKRENLLKFQKEINFSPKVYISHPTSKFNGWEKRKLLNYALKFRSKNAKNLYRDIWLQ